MSLKRLVLLLVRLAVVAGAVIGVMAYLRKPTVASESARYVGLGRK